MKTSEMATVAPFKTQNIPSVAMLSTHNIGTMNIWFGVVADLSGNQSLFQINLFTYPVVQRPSGMQRLGREIVFIMA